MKLALIVLFTGIVTYSGIEGLNALEADMQTHNQRIEMAVSH